MRKVIRGLICGAVVVVLVALSSVMPLSTVQVLVEIVSPLSSQLAQLTV